MTWFEDIVDRKRTGNHAVSIEKQRFIDQEIAFHLGTVKRLFDDGLDDSFVYNMDETHFIVNEDDGSTLGYRGEKMIKYADVTSGGVGMTLCVTIRGKDTIDTKPNWY